LAIADWRISQGSILLRKLVAISLLGKILVEKKGRCRQTESAIGNRQSEMPITVNITGFLTDFTNGVSSIELKSSPATVRQALNELWDLHVGLRDRVVTEQGQLRQHVNIFLNGENIRRQELLETAVMETGEITILPSVSGG
jgi:molybdopterin converting factor small subunit